VQLAFVVVIIGIPLGFVIPLPDTVFESAEHAYYRGDYEKAFRLFNQNVDHYDVFRKGGGFCDYMGKEEWYWPAATAQGFRSSSSISARNALSRIYLYCEPKTYANIDLIKRIKRIANHGDANAQALLGVLFFKGRGVPHDFVEGIGWYRKAAEQEHLLAQIQLGFAYRRGDGTSKDDREAAKLFESPAKAGFADAAYELGFMYLNGEGVPPDPYSAAEWFAHAADESWELADTGWIDKANYELGMMYYEGYPATPLDIEEAERRFLIARNSHAQAQEMWSSIQSDKWHDRQERRASRKRLLEEWKHARAKEEDRRAWLEGGGERFYKRFMLQRELEKRR
jgi:TPR repeat protein